jgi:hypothetical protein
MTKTERAILDLAESWHSSYRTEGSPDARVEVDLYQAVGAHEDEVCKLSPNTMWADLETQIRNEWLTSKTRGEHLISISFESGERDHNGYRIMVDGLYLESNTP